MHDHTLESTVLWEEVGEAEWDVVVVGAGPSGAVAARELARGGLRVLLADRERFPRDKVCGCCLNGAALNVLNDVGLGEMPRRLSARPLHTFHLAGERRHARLALRGGVTLSRSRLDAELVRAAIAEGTRFLDQTDVRIGELQGGARRIELKGQGRSLTASARAVVVAAGLGVRVFADRNEELRQVAPGSRVGAGTVLPEAPAYYAPGTIFMACHRHGYVGLVRLEDDRLDVAAALDSHAIKQCGGPASLVADVIVRAGFPLPDGMHAATWHGTGKLTQRRTHVAAERCFFVGDAAGYVEPFTGEGIAWALASGRAVAPIVRAILVGGGSVSWGMRQWAGVHRRLIARRTRTCRWISRLVRYPRIVRAAVHLLSVAPVLAAPVVQSLHHPFGPHGFQESGGV